MAAKVNIEDIDKNRDRTVCQRVLKRCRIGTGRRRTLGPRLHSRREWITKQRPDTDRKELGKKMAKQWLTVALTIMKLSFADLIFAGSFLKLAKPWTCITWRWQQEPSISIGSTCFMPSKTSRATSSLHVVSFWPGKLRRHPKSAKTSSRRSGLWPTTDNMQHSAQIQGKKSWYWSEYSWR